MIVRNDSTKAGLKWERDGRNERQGLGDGSSPAGRRQGAAAAHSWRRPSDVEVLGVTAWLGAVHAVDVLLKVEQSVVMTSLVQQGQVDVVVAALSIVTSQRGEPRRPAQRAEDTVVQPGCRLGAARCGGLLSLAMEKKAQRRGAPACGAAALHRAVGVTSGSSTEPRSMEGAGMSTVCSGVSERARRCSTGLLRQG